MDFASFGWLMFAGAIVFLMIGGISIHLIEWHLYVDTRADRDMIKETLKAMTLDRDGWRSVAERALLVAQIGKKVSARAANVVSVVSDTSRGG